MLKPDSRENITADYRLNAETWSLAQDPRKSFPVNKDTLNKQARVELANLFQQRFNAEPRVFHAPGRVNLIGEHTDYNQGLVMPAAINMGVWAGIASRTDRRVVVYSRQFDESFEFELDTITEKRGHWSDYIQGVAAQLQKSGFQLRGANILIDGEVPLGAGLSSSAAVETATAYALTQMAGIKVDSLELATLCQRAENEFVGARCGIMDQFISCLGEPSHCLMIDCRSLEYSRLLIPHEVCLVVCNTMVKHAIAGSEYNTRRAQCEEGVARLAPLLPYISSLRDVGAAELQKHCLKLPETIRKRCWHVVSEIQRVKDASQALLQHDLIWFGELMRRSHCSLRDNYEVSCRELDLMVEVASRQKGVYGARMTGGGFGGCTINLVRRDAADQFKANVAAEYQHVIGITPEIYITEASSGAGEVL